MNSDYVIVGAGLCGIVLATRLSEDPDVSVTVFEAGSGPFHDKNIDTPGYLPYNLGDPTKDWAFFSSPQANLGDRPVYLPRGKGIGGSTLLNFMEYSRATSVEYDSFEDLGATGWNWDNLVPYFRKSETLNYKERDLTKYGMRLKKEYHGTSGPLQLSVPPYLDNVALPWIETVKSLGVRTNTDANDGDNTGAWISIHSCDNKSVRSSAASAYYEPNQSRSNLNVITGALVTKILTSGEGEVVAHAVEYLKDGVLETFSATREVILCCGSYKTPQLLELSGIGDPEVLNRFGIKVVISLPGVGNNLQDHVTAAFTTELTPGHETWAKMSDLEFAQQQEDIFKETGGGMLSNIPSAFAALPLKDFDEDGSIVNLIHKEPATVTSEIQKQWALNPRVPFLEITGFDRFLPGTLKEPKADTDYMTTTMILLHPFSHGSAHIVSNDPNVAPEINHNYLNSPVDVKILVEAYKIARKIYDMAPLKYHIVDEVNPGVKVQSDEEISEYIRKTLDSTYHPIGTSSMLPREDKGVVDPRLRVYGTKNLRLVDASIIPVHISAHLQGTLYAISEKAADIIKEDAQK